MGLILLSIPLLSAIGVETATRIRAAQFVNVLVWSFPPLLLYSTFRRYLQGIHHVSPIPFALISSNVVNVLGNWVLIFGHWGAPAMGVRGSALSTVVARIYLALVLFIAVKRRDPLAFTEWEKLRAGAWQLLRIGFPAALAIGFEVGVFNAATALAGTLDQVSLAAHTIALNAAALTYMVPLGISSAAAVSVGRAIGAGDPKAAARAGWTALGLGAAYEVFSALAFVLFPRGIARLYTHDARVISFAVTLLAIAAVFQLFDGLQTVATGALRGLGKTQTPMLWNLIGYWIIGLPVGCWLCYRWDWGAVGLWDGLCLALILIGVGLIFVWEGAARHLTTARSHFIISTGAS
jgi:MATE family multidrug resistance protein